MLSAVGTISVSRPDRISRLTFYIELPQVLPRCGPVSVAISSELEQDRPVVTSVRQVEYSPSTLNRFARAMHATIAASGFRYSPKMPPKIGSKARKPALILRISFRRRHFLGRQSIPFPFGGALTNQFTNRNERIPNMKFITRSSPIMLALLLAASVTLAQTVEQLTFNSISAYAAFGYFDDTGCIITEIVVIPSEQITKQTGEQKTTSPLITVVVLRFDLCNAVTLLAAQGSTAQQNFTIDENLNTASVTATIPTNDGFSNQNFDVRVDLKWQATDALQKNKLKENNLIGDPSVMTTLKGDLRDAVATGNIVWTLGGDPMLDGSYINTSSIAGTLNKDSDSTISVTLP